MISPGSISPRRPASQPHRNALAFTLAELLVVIGVIALLSALLFPAVGKMQRRAAMAQDLNNLTQIGKAMAAYAAENEGRIPNLTIDVPGAGQRPSFMESVDRMMTPDSQANPASIYNWQRRPVWFSKVYAKMPSGQTYPSSQYYWGTAYGMNTFLWNNAAPLNGTNAFNGYLNRAPNLSKLVLVGEKNRSGGHDFDPRVAPVYQADADCNYRVSRDNKAYYLFGDYHVDLIEGDQSTAAHPEYKTYSPTNRLYYAW